MEAPAWVCKKLGEFHKRVRLAWDGELNKFGIIQLYHTKRDFSNSFREPWFSRYRGPLYSISGRPTYHDYDPLVWTPVYLIDVDSRDVCSGNVVRLVKSWVRPIVARHLESVDEQRREREHQLDSLGYEFGNSLYSRAHANTSGGVPVIAKKFIKPGDRLRKHLDGEYSAKEMWKTVEPIGGAKKHLDADQGDANSLGEISLK